MTLDPSHCKTLAQTVSNTSGSVEFQGLQKCKGVFFGGEKKYILGGKSLVTA